MTLVTCKNKSLLEFLTLVFVLFMVFLGWLIATNYNVSMLQNGKYYPLLLNILLGVGLYASVRGIDTTIASRDKYTLLNAVTFGVLFKVIIIGSVIYLITGEPISFLLAVIVAQIDPLSVGSLTNKNEERLSKRGRNILLAWASFDDPVTVVLAVVIAKYLIGIDISFADTPWFIQSFNLIIPAIAYQIHKFTNNNTIMSLLLLFIFIVSVYYGFMLAIAISALFVRPKLYIKVSHLVETAYIVSLIIFGTYLVGSIDIAKGLALAFGAIISQVIVSLILTWKLDTNDRVYLAFAQQNGVTAVILSLLFANAIEGIVPIVAVAIVTINVFHMVSFGMIEKSLNHYRS